MANDCWISSNSWKRVRSARVRSRSRQSVGACRARLAADWYINTRHNKDKYTPALPCLSKRLVLRTTAPRLPYRRLRFKCIMTFSVRWCAVVCVMLTILNPLMSVIGLPLLHPKPLRAAPAALHPKPLSTAPAALHRKPLTTAPAVLHPKPLTTA